MGGMRTTGVGDESPWSLAGLDWSRVQYVEWAVWATTIGLEQGKDLPSSASRKLDKRRQLRPPITPRAIPCLTIFCTHIASSLDSGIVQFTGYKLHARLSD